MGRVKPEYIWPTYLAIAILVGYGVSTLLKEFCQTKRKTVVYILSPLRVPAPGHLSRLSSSWCADARDLDIP